MNIVKRSCKIWAALAFAFCLLFSANGEAYHGWHHGGWHHHYGWHHHHGWHHHGWHRGWHHW